MTLLRFWPTTLSVLLVAVALLPKPERVPAPEPPWRPDCVGPYPPPPPEEIPPGGVLRLHSPFELRVFHHSELPLLFRFDPRHPDPELGPSHCLVKVQIAPDGFPVRADAEACPYAERVEAAVRDWRWAPLPTEDGCIYARTTVRVDLR